MNHWMFLCGTGEQANKEQLARRMMEPLIKQGDIVEYVQYPASIGIFNPTRNPLDITQSSYQSRREGLKNLVAAIRRTGNVPVLVGYSLGAWVVSELLSSIARGLYPDLEVKLAITIGNPLRRPSVQGSAYGIAGSHEPYTVEHAELWSMDDIISNCPPNSILRKLPVIAEVFTGMPDKDYSIDTWRMLAGDWMKVHWAFPTLRDLQLIQKYVDGTGHVKDYLTAPYWEQVAQLGVL